MINISDREDWTQIDSVMSNMDHEIDLDAEDKLKADKVYSSYPAWNFYSWVWYEVGKFHCEIWTYGCYRETITADSLQDIMDQASSKYGND